MTNEVQARREAAGDGSHDQGPDGLEDSWPIEVDTLLYQRQAAERWLWTCASHGLVEQAVLLALVAHGLDEQLRKESPRAYLACRHRWEAMPEQLPHEPGDVWLDHACPLCEMHDLIGLLPWVAAGRKY